MIETVATLVTLCKTALEGMKWTKEKYESKKMSDEESSILRAAADQGTIQIIMCESLLHVFAGGTVFQDDDPAVAARYFDAFAELCDRGLVTHHGGDLFCLNGKGFEIARKLTAETRPVRQSIDDD